MSLDETRPAYLSRTLLRLARGAWVVLTLLAVGLFVIGTWEMVREPLPMCTDVGAICNASELSAEDLEAIGASGLLRTLVIAFFAVLGWILNAAFVVVAVVIFWRRADDWMALIFSLTLALLGMVVFTSSTDVVSRNHREWSWAVDALANLAIVSFFFLLYLFPDGRVVPRWTRYILLVSVLIVLVRYFNLNLVPEPVLGLWLVTLVGSAIYARIYRYRRVSSNVERQQTKWMAFGLLGALGEIFTWFIIAITFPPDVPGPARTYGLMFGILAFFGFGMIFPLSTAFAILRYRLWDIDVIIRRTLVYSMVTVTLALTYTVNVVLFQIVLRALTGQTSDLAIIASTLAIAALFHPLRSRIQALIDRRFYRHKYDAARTLAAFNARSRNEVELPKLTEDLLAVIDTTLQPAHVSLWLHEDAARSLARPGKNER